MHVARFGGDRLNDARQLDLDQFQGVRERNAFQDDMDARVVAMGIKVDIVDDPELA
jgi:hypothetical protein